MKKKPDNSLLDALFNREPDWEPSMTDLLFGRQEPDERSPGRRRAWPSGKDECPNCGAVFPTGGFCPGCGLHDEEMPWRDR